MKEMKIILIFAGNKNEFEYWLNGNMPAFNKRPSNIIYVSSYEKSLGFSDPLIIRVGTWYKHKWISEAISRYEHINEQKVDSPTSIIEGDKE